ncbi:MAG: UDP-N-acetylmuramoyl-tripeptide--D-alanyl-D-alanine ligase [Deltaproteobacteria bacterium]|nr:UDP-N-acetylmuramoyl-tripeptide--D-alanyl-D-alanine ligase [Deltaproteobacteria bacterium]MCL5277374.1 UDP-N-acetylmuramoyl-tripeptide--D-alanyl-D-alanine ligase [Deltaproteobacteria bacterium]
MKDIETTHGMDVLNGPADWCAEGVTTDTRKPVRGMLFFALRGERFDGHDFLQTAVSLGAAGVVVDRNGTQAALSLKDRTAVFAVDDTVLGLGMLAHAVRAGHGPTVIAITGSSGKTTTKEMLASILSRTHSTGKTRGNLNNAIGLPLSILNMEPGTSVWVLEIGTSRYGELGALTRIADPDIGVLTNVGMAHLESFHSLDGVARAKSEMFSAMSGHGTAVLNADDPRAMGIAGTFGGRVASAGFSEKASLRVVSYGLMKDGTGSEFEVSYEGERRGLTMPLTGRHYLHDMALAVLCARLLRVPWDDIRAACAGYRGLGGRGTAIPYESGITVIDDTYNANPDSMREGFLSAIERYGADSIVAVIGDMLELGEHSREQHSVLGRLLADRGVRRFILTGRFAGDTLEGIESAGARGVHARRADSVQEIVDGLLAVSGPHSVVYVKGSRGMGLERVVAEYDRAMRCGNA